MWLDNILISILLWIDSWQQNQIDTIICSDIITLSAIKFTLKLIIRYIIVSRFFVFPNISAVQHERGPRKPKLHNALMASAQHQNHLQLQGLVSSVSAYAQNSILSTSHSSGFHPVIPHMHHSQPMSFGPIVHPAHHVQNPHAHHPHLLTLPPANGDFYKNPHLPSNIIVPSVLSHPMPLLATSMSSHMTASLPPQTTMPTPMSAAASHHPSSHSTISHQSHHSPKSSSASSVIEPSQDSVGSPLIVDNIDSVASPISVSSNSNNNNNNNMMSNNMNAIKSRRHDSNAVPTGNGVATDSSSGRSNGDAVVSTSNSNHRNAVRTAQNNGLMDILMNPDKCQVNID